MTSRIKYVQIAVFNNSTRGKNNELPKKALVQVLRSPFSVLRSPVNPRPVHRLKLNTVFRLTFILTLGGAGLTAYANIQKAQAANKQAKYATFSFAEHLKTRAEQDYARGGYVLRMMYKEGRGVPQDDQLAVQWFRKAAEQGQPVGGVALGEMYKQGRGVPRDDRLAVQWFRNVAEQGYALGHYKLGIMYREGRGVPKNYVYAYMWIHIAAPVISELVDKESAWDMLLRNIFGEITLSQIEEAKVLAIICISKQYKDCEV